MCESSSLSECTICRNSLVVELLITNQTTRVRFSLAAPYKYFNAVFGAVAHWSCSGLKIHRRRFDSSLSHHRHIAQSGQSNGSLNRWPWVQIPLCLPYFWRMKSDSDDTGLENRLHLRVWGAAPPSSAIIQRFTLLAQSGEHLTLNQGVQGSKP